jgi:hypothetical protein
MYYNMDTSLRGRVKHFIVQPIEKLRMTKRGRPATFDRDEALQPAMELFWARGYVGVTLEDLQVAAASPRPASIMRSDRRRSCS